MSDRSKQLISSIKNINIAILLFFWLLFLLSYSFNNLYFSVPLLGVLLASMFVVVYYLYLRSNVFNRQRKGLKIDAKTKKLLLTPNILGYVFLGIGIYLVSVYQTQQALLPGGGSHTSYIHIYSTEGSALIMLGILTELLSWYLYSKEIPKLFKESPAPA